MGPKTIPQTRQTKRRRAEAQTIAGIPLRVRLGPAAAVLATALLLWASFPPLDWGFLAWFALVPLLQLVRARPRPNWLYFWVWIGGLIYWLAAVQWMRHADDTAYSGWVALAFYLSLYFPAFVWLARAAVHRLQVPLEWSAAVVWVGLELARSHLLTGFSWYFLAHTQYRWITLIQASDLAGAYGVSFLLALAGGCLARLVPGRWLVAWGINVADDVAGAVERQVRIGRLAVSRGMMVVVTLLVAVIGYGVVRRAQADFRPGPKVALVQGNVPQTVKSDIERWRQIFDEHVDLTERAARHDPDLIVWPETMFRWPLVRIEPDVTDEHLSEFYPNIDPQRWWRPLSRDIPRTLAGLSEKNQAPLLVGVDAVDFSAAGLRRYNSAILVTPDEGIVGRYDKLHLVPFGEYLPLAESMPWLLKFTPFERVYGLDVGDEPSQFALGQWRFSAVICFEDTVPHLVRRFVNEGRPAKSVGHDAPTNTASSTAAGSDAATGALRPPDFFVNLTNDGWFKGSSELDQHLITAAFRSVECRTPMVRAVNTGISAIIDGDGRIVQRARDPETGRSKQVEDVVVGHVPLDDRTSLYVLWGDWFAGACLLACVGLAVVAVIPRRRAA